MIITPQQRSEAASALRCHDLPTTAATFRPFGNLAVTARRFHAVATHIGSRRHYHETHYEHLCDTRYPRAHMHAHACTQTHATHPCPPPQLPSAPPPQDNMDKAQVKLDDALSDAAQRQAACAIIGQDGHTPHERGWAATVQGAVDSSAGPLTIQHFTTYARAGEMVGSVILHEGIVNGTRNQRVSTSRPGSHPPTATPNHPIAAPTCRSLPHLFPPLKHRP